MPARLAAERDSLFPHPPPKARIAGRRNLRRAAVRGDVVDCAARRLRIQQHGRARPTLQQRTRQQRRQPVRFVAAPEVIDHAHPIAVRVPGDAQIQPQRRDRVGQVDHRRRLLRIGDVRAVGHDRVVNGVRGLGQRRQRGRSGAADHAVARIDRDAQPAAGKARREHFEVVGRDVAVLPRRAARRAPLAASRDRRNLIAQQRQRLRAEQLEAVVFGRVVAGRHDQPAAQLELIDRPADHRRGAEPQRFNRDPGRS